MPRGGKRENSGRKPLEPKKSIRVPVSKLADVYKLIKNGKVRVPL